MNVLSCHNIIQTEGRKYIFNTEEDDEIDQDYREVSWENIL